MNELHTQKGGINIYPEFLQYGHILLVQMVRIRSNVAIVVVNNATIVVMRVSIPGTFTFVCVSKVRRGDIRKVFRSGEKI